MSQNSSNPSLPLRIVLISLAGLAVILLARESIVELAGRYLLAVSAGLIATATLVVISMLYFRQIKKQKDANGGKYEISIALVVVVLVGICTVFASLNSTTHPTNSISTPKQLPSETTFVQNTTKKPGNEQLQRTNTTQKIPPQGNIRLLNKADISAVPGSSGQVASKNIDKTRNVSRNKPQTVTPPNADRIKSLVKKAEVAQKSADHDSVVSLLSQALREMDRFPSPNLETRSNLSVALAKSHAAKGEIEDAIEVVEQQLSKINRAPQYLPNQAAALNEEIGSILGNTGRYEASLDRFETALEIKQNHQATAPDIASTQAKLAVSYARLGNKGDARQFLTNARKLLLTIDPPDPESLTQLNRISREYSLEL